MTGGSLVRIRAMVRKETWHILRDWQTLAIVLAMPVAMMFLYGYALTLDITDARIVIEDPLPSTQTRHLAGSLDATTLFKVAAVVRSAGDPAQTLKHFEAKALVKFPPGFGRDMRDGGSAARVQVLIDGADQNVGNILMHAIQPAIRNGALELLNITPPEPVEVHSRVLYNPQQKTSLFFVPGLMALLLTLLSALLTALAITREKEFGTMEQLLVSPVRPVEVLVGKIAPYVVISAAMAVLVLGTGWLFFDVRVQGSLLFLAGACLLYLTTTLALGLLFSTVAKTQQQALLLALPATMMPTVVLSGFIFPVSSFPVWLQAISHIIPAYYFIQVLRGIMLKGVGPLELWPQLTCLTAMGVFFLAVATKRFRTRL